MTIFDRYKANKKLWNTLGIFVACSLVHNFPVLLDYVPTEIRGTIQTFASYFMTNAIIPVLFWAKQYNNSGDGSTADPLRKTDSNGDVTVIK